jgi:hypothetical protein
MDQKREGIDWNTDRFTRRALVGSRIGSSGSCEVDPARLSYDLKLNFVYVVEDIKVHHLRKESPHLVG